MTDRVSPQPDVVAYLRYLKVRNCRDQTIYNRRRSLARLALWAEGRPLLELTGADLAKWEDERTSQITPNSRRAELSNVREFYRWAYRGEMIERDPTVGLSMPRARRGVPRPVGENDLAMAFEAADDRMAAILGLAAFAGLRALRDRPTRLGRGRLAGTTADAARPGRQGRPQQDPHAGASARRSADEAAGSTRSGDRPRRR
jgi:hypothetical protein